PYKLLGQMYFSLTNVDIGINQELILNPGKYSLDFDLDTGVFTDFAWFARCGSEEYPTDSSGELKRTHLPLRDPDSNPLGGLEGNGPGRISDEKVEGGEMRLIPGNFDGIRAGMTCEIMATFRKTLDPYNRTGRAIITINVFETQVPMFKIITGNGTQAEPDITPDQRSAQKINPIGTFRALSDCIGTTNCEEVTFEWSFRCLRNDVTPPIDFADVVNYDYITLTNNETLQPNTKLRVDNKLQNIGVPTALLYEQTRAGVTDCYLGLTVCMADEKSLTSTCGMAGMAIILNLPPTGGNLRMEHAPVMQYGNCLENYMFWRFSFDNWTDPDDNCIKSYKIIQISGPNMLDVPLEQELMTLDPYEVQQTALYSGPENPYNEKISFGNKNKNWNIVVCVRVTDCFGAFTFFCVKDRFVRIKMSEMSTCKSVAANQSTTTREPVEDTLQDLNLPKDSRVKQILIGDPQELETEFMNMQLMIESAIVDNMTKYWAEKSQKWHIHRKHLGRPS
ncbi:uncharacterized protein LOC142355045, partial [Convolutriloba macropyga]|uniref:uncharacterized protein LOC142355045 n=1 Tax=Convolutriloba macropyga TaxID=536237 RepID=UPI003F52759A